MKRLIPLIILILLFCSCKLDVPINDGTYFFADGITLSYDGYNSSIKTINKINTEEGLKIELYGGESSFESLLFIFNEKTYIKSVNLCFDDSLSYPQDNCYFCILCNNLYKPCDYNSYNYTDFQSIKTIEINEYCKNIKLFFSSNKSNKQKRLITIYNIDFILE